MTDGTYKRGKNSSRLKFDLERDVRVSTQVGNFKRSLLGWFVSCTVPTPTHVG